MSGSFLRDRIDQIKQTAYLTSHIQNPGDIAAITRNDRDLLTVIPLETIEAHVPGFLNNDHLEAIYTQEPESWVPEPALMNELLYAGQGDVEGLKKFTEIELFRFCRDIRLRDLSADGEKATETLSSLHLLETLHTVETFMEGQTRRTGEPGIAHVYRTTLRTLDFLRRQNTLFNMGHNVGFFNAQTSEAILMTAILHDFAEDVFVKKTDQGEYEGRRGKVERLDALGGRDGIQTGLRLSIFECKGRTKQDLHDGETIDVVDLPDIDERVSFFIMNALDALKSDLVAPDDIIDHLLERIDRTKRNVNSRSLSNQLFPYIAAIVKMMDRCDNLATYTFRRGTDGQYEPAPLEKIKEKADEQLQIFPRLECAIWDLGTDPFIFKNMQHARKFGYDNMLRPEDLLVHTSTLESFPTRWARLVKLGVNPNQMYKRNWSTYLPEMI